MAYRELDEEEVIHYDNLQESFEGFGCCMNEAEETVRVWTSTIAV